MFLVLVWMHFVADFVLQSHRMSRNKSWSWKWLGAHTLVYGTVFLWAGAWFALATSVTHGAVDAVTSRVTSRLWKREAYHSFFVMIGFDQAVHLTTLVLLARVAWLWW